MIFLLLLALAAAASAPAPAPEAIATRDLINGAEHALRVGRVDQAKLMIERAVGAGASGPGLDRALAEFAYVSGKTAEASARYEALLTRFPADRSLLEPAGIAALKLGRADHARALLSRATSGAGASWRAWNALGIAADQMADWSLADRSFAEAARLAPSEAAPINNLGWSLLLQGRWSAAADKFAKAAALDPKSPRIADNLELAMAALASDLPQRRPGESSSSWAARLNDAGVAATILGEKARAAAAFTRALEASDTWYARAAGNLEVVASR
jgi:Flp pilus assembly protein TadD